MASTRRLRYAVADRFIGHRSRGRTRWRALVDKLTHDKSRGEVVVFLLGMRVNKFWRPDAWLPVFIGQARMLRELSRDPNSGLLGHRTTIGRDGGTSIQYWTDTESLYRYAADAARLHKPALVQYYRKERTAKGAVGIWHETFKVAASETIYGDMPPIGMGAALGLVPVTKSMSTAARRLAATATPTHGQDSHHSRQRTPSLEMARGCAQVGPPESAGPAHGVQRRTAPDR